MESIQSKLSVGAITSYFGIFKGKFDFIEIVIFNHNLTNRRININKK